MLEELIKEINELRDYKIKYESLEEDKRRMSDKLFELMMEKYNNQSYQERVEIFKKEGCRDCRYKYNCDLKDNLPQDIWIPIESDKAWIPAMKSCGEFQWS